MDNIPEMPDMTEEEILERAGILLSSGLRDMDYADIVRALTVANYVSDLCIRVLGDRGLLDYIGDMPCIPDARPADMEIENAIVIPRSRD